MKIHTSFARPRDSLLIFCLVAAACALFSACATVEDTNANRRDIMKLQSDTATMQHNINDLMGKTAGVAKEESFHAVRQSQAEIQGQLSDVSRDIQILSGRFDENKYFMEKSLQNTSSEIELLKVMKSYIGREFEAEIVIDTAEESTSPKAKFAAPGKPGIQIVMA